MGEARRAGGQRGLEQGTRAHYRVPHTLKTLVWLRRVEDRLVTGLAYLCGALFLLLAFYTTLDVVGRRWVGLFSGVTDEMGEYALALGASWALAYTLGAGGHVRVDVLFPYLRASVRNILDALAMAVMAAFASTVSVFLWTLVASSYAIDAIGHSLIQTPQWMPQAMMAGGYSLLALVAATEFVGYVIGAPRTRAADGGA